MPPALILAIDQGTTSSRAAIIDETGDTVAVAQRPHAQQHPSPGYVEHDPMEILAAVTDCVAAVRDAVDREPIGVGLTNQRETIVLWDRESGLPVAPAIVWQDTRTADHCASLAAAELLVRERTGLTLGPYFSATKLAWLLDHVPGARARANSGELAAGTIDSWLAWHCTGRHLTDVSNASRTLLLDTRSMTWDDELLELFDIPRALLAEVVPTWRPGGIAPSLVTGPLRGVPLLAMIGDQQAALLGQGCVAAGDAKCTYGTGAFLLAQAGVRRPEATGRLLVSPAWQSGDEPPSYCLEGPMAVAGAAIGWLADLGLMAEPSASADLAGSVDSSGGVRLVPAFQGLYAPWWDSSAKGALHGLTLHTTAAHIVRAAIEALAFQTRAIVETAEADAQLQIPALRIDGGATRNPVLVQTLADVLGRPVVRAVDAEATVRGAAFAAGLAAGLWTGTADLADHGRPDEAFEPRWTADRRDAEYADWLRAVERCRGSR